MRDVSLLLRVAERLNSAPDADSALGATLALLEELLELPTSWVWLEDGGRFYLAAAHSLPPYLSEPVRMTGTPCWCLQSYQAAELAPRNVGVMECSRLRPAVRKGDTGQTRGLAHHATIPLTFRGRPLGILNVAAPAGRALRRRELKLLAAIGFQLGLALERARLASETGRLARMEERDRLARDLHDTLAQGLTGAALGVEGALRVLETRPETARERLKLALEQIRQNLEAVRGTVLSLRSPLEGRSLGQAVGDLAHAFASRSGVRVLLHLEEVALDGRVETELYRILQECLANVQRHARAQEVQVRLTSRGLSVEDDGVGFAGRAGGHGVLGMRERCRAIGARLSVSGRPGRGTRVQVRL
ncbi:MAG: GAF domain-containing sensor histidine kinase [Candidatus Eremiobacterota bacterium]